MGCSFGGCLAYEVACQLREQRQDVSFLGLIDTILPAALGAFGPKAFDDPQVPGGPFLQRGGLLDALESVDRLIGPEQLDQGAVDRRGPVPHPEFS
ncbi:thioesterase domain-containing protein [Streptomyces bobili]|uniref:thioesterase domain-containing protein n=1 Tax=Streptomyces bobili TaxID=67280 RepID=UPI0036FF9356